MPIYNLLCTKCGYTTKQLIAAKDKDNMQCKECDAYMEAQLPSSLSTSVYVAADKYRGTQVRKNLDAQLKDRMTKHHDKYELEKKIEEHGTDDAQKHGWFKKVKRM